MVEHRLILIMVQENPPFFLLVFSTSSDIGWTNFVPVVILSLEAGFGFVFGISPVVVVSSIIPVLSVVLVSSDPHFLDKLGLLNTCYRQIDSVGRVVCYQVQENGAINLISWGIGIVVELNLDATKV